MAIIDYQETLDDLKKKGLTISDEKEFMYYIKNFNVNTFVNEYSDFFQDENGNFIDVDSKDIINLYTFDKNMAIHIFKNLLFIEKIINTNVAVETINVFSIESKCLLDLEENILRNSVLRNINQVEPYTEFRTFLYKITRYLDSNKSIIKLID
jgi:hypothetical protein